MESDDIITPLFILGSYVMKEGVFSLRYNEGGNEREVIISLGYNHSLLHFNLGNNEGWSAQGSDYILGYITPVFTSA